MGVAMVMSMIRGVVAADRLEEVRGPYAAAITAGTPPGIVTTYLLSGPGDLVAIATIWRDRAALDAMIATGEEPLARRLIREAGGEPSAEFFEVMASSAAP